MICTRLLLILIAALIHHSTSLYEDDTHIERLTASNFDELILDSYHMWIVKFYSSRCRYSINAAAEFSMIAKQLSDSFLFGAVDCIQEREVCFRWYGIRAFPTVGFLYEDMIINHNGEISVENVTRAAHQAFKTYDRYFNEKS